MDALIIGELKFIFMLISFSIWTMFYNVLRNRYPYKSPRFCNHHVTVFYAISSLMFMYLTPELRLYLAVEPPNRGWAIVNLTSLIMTWGYYAFNLIWTMYYDDDSVTYANFVISLLLVNNYIFIKSSNREVVIKGLGYLELSSPSAQSKLYLRKFGENTSMYYKLVETVAYSTLALVRILYGSYYVSTILFSTFYDPIDKLAASYFYVIGILQFYNVVPLWRKLLTPEDKRLGALHYYNN